MFATHSMFVVRTPKGERVLKARKDDQVIVERRKRRGPLVGHRVGRYFGLKTVTWIARREHEMKWQSRDGETTRMRFFTRNTPLAPYSLLYYYSFPLILPPLLLSSPSFSDPAF